MSYYSNRLIQCNNLTQNMHTFRKKIALLKVKLPIKGKKSIKTHANINFYHWFDLSTQNMKNRYHHNNTLCKYRLIIVIEKNPPKILRYNFKYRTALREGERRGKINKLMLCPNTHTYGLCTWSLDYLHDVFPEFDPSLQVRIKTTNVCIWTRHEIHRKLKERGNCWLRKDTMKKGNIQQAEKNRALGNTENWMRENWQLSETGRENTAVSLSLSLSLSLCEWVTSITHWTLAIKPAG